MTERLHATRRMEIVIAAAGVALALLGALANQQWLDGHFLPSFFMPRSWYVLIERGVRTLMIAGGLCLATVARRRLASVAARDLIRVCQIALACILALTASEVALRFVRVRPTEWLLPKEEPVRRLDPRVGWTLEPARTGRASVGGRQLDYAIDASGYRVDRADNPVDRSQPSLIFAGESVMFGEGLRWEETIPAQTATMLGVQSANIAVHGYSTDQTYLRLATELPRFRRPVAVIALFMTALFGRNLDEDRPHLGPGLEWRPAVPSSRLMALARLIVPFRRTATVDRGVRTTRETLAAIASLARARGAAPLIIVPHFGREDEPDVAIRRRVFDGADLPMLTIDIEESWRLPWDRHPNARAAHAIAAAIAGRLRPSVAALQASR